MLTELRSMDQTNSIIQGTGSIMDKCDGFKSCSPLRAPIAITGMACRLPGHCNSPRDLWEFMMGGNIANIEPPASRFDLKGHYDGSLKPNTMKTPGGMFMEDVDPASFDAQFFNINHADASSMDPQQRVLLEVSYECLENAGITKERLEGTRLGCIVGASAVDYHDMDCRDPEDRTESPTMGSCRSLLSNRISHFLGVHGPSITIDTACSSALTAVQLACMYLRSGEADAMLVCGVNMYFSPERNQDMGAMRPTASSTGRCYSFDSRADGYVIAEAANAVVLKRADDAVRDGDPIRAIIRGVAVNSAGKTAGIAMPNPKAQAGVVRDAYKNAGISRLEFSQTAYVECHGTGTQVGDPAEAEGLAAVFCQPDNSRQTPLFIGSVKGNIGHSEAAAGLSGIIKVVLALENGVIPGTATFESPKKSIDLKAMGLEAFHNAIPWPTETLRASVNAFGFGGANAHAVLESPKYFLGPRTPRHKSCYVSTADVFEDLFVEEEVPENDLEAAQPKAHLLLLSANDEDSLEAYISSLSSHLLDPTVQVSVSDLAYTLSERRSRLHYRAFAVSSNTNITRHSFTFVKRVEDPPKIAFVFTGQGAQWPMMGKVLLKNFAVARDIVKKLDEYLEELQDPPTFSLLDELVKDQEPSNLRHPELSQPLTTALQLAFLGVLSAWDIIPSCVVGHSSGEIAAAVVAGYLSSKDAIKLAFLRGQAIARTHHDEPLGMMAVGVAADTVGHYIDPADDLVQIACLNSPTNVTVSGTVSALEKLRLRLQQDGHFARLLHVDVAYHSNYVQTSGDIYDALVRKSLGSIFGQTKCDRIIPMFSTVTGDEIKSTPDGMYWKDNLTSQVKFDVAIGRMLESMIKPNIFIEIGPSNTLSGPISQIFKAFSISHPSLRYTSVAQRTRDGVTSLYSIPGLIVSLGGLIDIAAVNQYDDPSVLVDLPNYSWNHSIQHWHESLSSKDWRYRAFAKHDLLGSKIPATTWHYPTWRSMLKIQDLPWLADHRLGDQVVFPASGYICMAIEAVYQATAMTNWKESHPDTYTLRMRNVKFSRALVLDTSRSTAISLSLAPASGLDNWYEFRVSSMTSDIWTNHASGLVRVVSGLIESRASPDMVLPLRDPTTTESWYNSMGAVGLKFGPAFQKQLAIESKAGCCETRSTVSLVPPQSAWRQSFYILHPACLDGCFQAASSALWQGDRCNISTAMVPCDIDSLTLPFSSEQPSFAFASARSKYIGVGRQGLIRNWYSDCSVLHPNTGSLLLEIAGMRLIDLESSQKPTSPHVYTKMSWDADFRLLSDVTVQTVVDEAIACCTAGNDDERAAAIAYRFISMATHNRPDLKIAEMNLVSEKTSCFALDWYKERLLQTTPALNFSQYSYYSNIPSTVASVEKRHQGTKKAEFILFDYAMSTPTPSLDVDLVIIALPAQYSDNATRAIQNIMPHLRKGGFAIFLSQNATHQFFHSQITHANLNPLACSSVISIGQRPLDVGCGIDLSAERRTLKIVQLSHCHDKLQLPNPMWELEYVRDPVHIQHRDKVLVLDELKSPVMASINNAGWNLLKALVRAECDILWVTRGSQMHINQPDASIIHGLFRAIRGEYPGLNLITLDVEQPSGDVTFHAIDKCLSFIYRDPKSNFNDSEYVERAGVFYVSRVLPDMWLNKAVDDDVARTRHETLSFQDKSRHIIVQAEKVGSLGSLHYYEVEGTTGLSNGQIEIQVMAAGVNFKDVAITLGLIPGNECLLGGEGSGLVTRVAPDVTNFQPGQRVAFFEKGSFANKVVTSTKLVQAIPDSMSFLEAATIPCVFLTSMYCLCNLAGMKAGDQVLIHSASGGVGIAAIQLCHSIGATVFATVGSQEKREFLHSKFGIPNERIFNSHTRDFAREIMCYTQGRGVDIILNSLTGDLLDESWRIIADGGTMVEIGKKDILSRASLSMEPFNRNASFRAFDLSHKEMDDAKLERLLTEIFRQVNMGILHPISPIHRFSFAEIPSALRYIGSGKHIGKLVIGDEHVSDIYVPVRPIPRNMRLKGNASYLIVGGLRGVCGSIALCLARNGARYLTVMSRSGDQDPKSQRVREDLECVGCSVNFVRGDVTSIQHVRAAFDQSAPPIYGVIQGTMILRDRTFDSMTLEDYQATLSCKVQGTWNLHTVSLEQQNNLDFFTLLSSVSGVAGRKGQANYAAANTFLNAFAAYRRNLGLRACSISLGVVEHIGYLAEHQAVRKGFDQANWHGIDEPLLRQILSLSIQQQMPSPVSAASASHMITGIHVPQPKDSQLLNDPRFSGLGPQEGNIEMSNAGDRSEDVRALHVAIRSKANPKTLLNLATDVCNRYLVQNLRMSTALDPSRPLSVYGVDSLVTVEFRGFLRGELGVDLTTLEVLSASSLSSICELVIKRIQF